MPSVITNALIREKQMLMMSVLEKDVPMEAEVRMVWPRAKECGQPLEAGKYQERILP